MLAALLAALVALQAPVPPSPRAPRAPASPRPPRAVPAPPAPGEGQLLGEWPEKPSGKRVTLKDKMDVDEALEDIASAAGWNLVANTGRAGDRTLILNLRDVYRLPPKAPCFPARCSSSTTASPPMPRRSLMPTSPLTLTSRWPTGST